MQDIFIFKLLNAAAKHGINATNSPVMVWIVNCTICPCIQAIYFTTQAHVK